MSIISGSPVKPTPFQPLNYAAVTIEQARNAQRLYTGNSNSKSTDFNYVITPDPSIGHFEILETSNGIVGIGHTAPRVWCLNSLENLNAEPINSCFHYMPQTAIDSAKFKSWYEPLYQNVDKRTVDILL